MVCVSEPAHPWLRGSGGRAVISRVVCVSEPAHPRAGYAVLEGGLLCSCTYGYSAGFWREGCYAVARMDIVPALYVQTCTKRGLVPVIPRVLN